MMMNLVIKRPDLRLRGDAACLAARGKVGGVTKRGGRGKGIRSSTVEEVVQFVVS